MALTTSPPIHPVQTSKTVIGKPAGLQDLPCRVGVMALSLSAFRAASECTRKRCQHQIQQLARSLRKGDSSQSQGSAPRRKKGSRNNARGLTHPAAATHETLPAQPKRVARHLLMPGPELCP